jgi:hypothetical protein
MKYRKLPCAAVLVFSASITGFSADPIYWGGSQRGLQLGIGASTASERGLQVSLKNTGAEARQLAVGVDGSAGPAYDVNLFARSPQGKELVVFDTNALQVPAEGLILPNTVLLQPGAATSFAFPLKHLMCVVNRKDVPLEALLNQGYTVRASFEQIGFTIETP